MEKKRRTKGKKVQKKVAESTAKEKKKPRRKKAQLVLKCVTGELRGKKFNIPERKRKFSIGRSTRSDIVIPDECASLKHASLISKPDGGVFIEDLKSRNGTFVNGERISKETLLSEGDRIMVGVTTLKLVPSQAQESVFSTLDAGTIETEKGHFRITVMVEEVG